MFIRKECRLAAILAMVCNVLAFPAAAEPTKLLLNIRGGYVFGDDQILLGTPPDNPGWATYGDGRSGAARIELRRHDWSFLLQAQHTRTEDVATAFRQPLGIPVSETDDLMSTFTVIDAAMARHQVTGTVSTAVIIGLRYLQADHDLTFRTVFGPPINATDVRRIDVSFAGLGPRLAFGAQGPISGPFGWFGQAGGSVLFGTAKLDGNLVPAWSRSRRTTVYSADAELGFSLQFISSDGPSSKLSVGYRVEAWWNTHPDDFGLFYPQTSSRALHHGPFAEVTFIF